MAQEPAGQAINGHRSGQEIAVELGSHFHQATSLSYLFVVLVVAQLCLEIQKHLTENTKVKAEIIVMLFFINLF